MHEFIDFFLQISDQLGYWGILFLMAVESSFIPFPSEVIIPPAAYLASQGQMNLYLVILFGVLGSIIGAVINYFLAMYLGRAIIYKVAGHKVSKCLFIDCSKIKKAEDYFLQHGSLSTLIGRLIPVIRQLISIPAGFARMNFTKFIIYTGLGSAIWVTTLALLGYLFGSNQEALSRYYKEISLVFIIIALMIATFIVLKKMNGHKKK
ncbi:DedA family protein [Candidatus Falkowbacteria bacterium]|nr:DedA family protein [Candidatus Falkowbacteria bacterium]